LDIHDGFKKYTIESVKEEEKGSIIAGYSNLL
jgi:hypothetical protein